MKPSHTRPPAFLLYLALAVLIVCGLASPVAAQRNLQQVRLPDETLDQWIFGSGNDARTGRQNLEGLLALRVAEIQRLCNLSDAQSQKLKLAGMGDVKHFFNRAESIKRKIQAIVDENAVNLAFQDIQPLQQEFNNGLFGETSLFAKVRRRTLTAEQSLHYEQYTYERLRIHYRSRASFILMKLEQSLPLTSDQRERLLKLIDEETKPPVRFGQYDWHYIMRQLSQVPEEKLRAILDKPQWQIMKQNLDSVRGFEPFLKSNGIVPYEPPEATPTGNATDDEGRSDASE